MRKLFSLIPLFLLLACSTEPQKIDYGNENCHLCGMTISDDRFASELVMKTGKVQKYGSIECMVNDIQKTIKFDKNNVDNLYVMDMTNPGFFIPVSKSYFLISPKIKSPMGANLAAFGNKSTAEEKKSKWGGNIYDWDTLLKTLK